MFNYITMGFTILSLTASFSTACASINQPIEKHSSKKIPDRTQIYVHHGAILLLAEENGFKEEKPLGKETNSLVIESTESFKKGLELCKKKVCEEDDPYYTSVLASYYFYSLKQMKEGLYFANVAAEKGQIDAIQIMFIAYCTGRGVLTDEAEAQKWLIILSLLGEKRGIDHIKRITDYRLSVGKKDATEEDKKTLETIKEAEKRAKKWAEKHKELFFQPT